MAIKSEAALSRKREYQKEYSRTHRDLINSRHRAYMNAWAKRDPERRFLRYLKYRLKKKYGLTVDQYYTLIEDQNRRCAICKQVLKVPTATYRIVRDGNAAVVDHKGPKVRGILCNNCNRAIGLFHDSTEALKSAIIYLEKQGDPCTHVI